MRSNAQADSSPLDYQPARADRPLPVRYMPQLDGLRALAVFAVWIEHWSVNRLPVVRYVPWGQFGVWLFFVLSGFLITGILLRAKDGIDRRRSVGGKGGLASAALNFYARRFLRILPIYYLALLATTFLLRIADMRQVFWWHLTYTTNFRVAMGARFPEQGGIHFWTLAVEEQFYLIWPAIILLVPRRHLLKAIFATLIGGLAFRVACVLVAQRGAAGVWPFACFDLFAYGAALAALGADPRRASAADAFRRWCGRLGLPALLALLLLYAWHLRHFGRDAHLTTANLLLDPLAAGAVFAWVIARSARGFGGIVGRLLECGPLLYLGRISYGLYVYHNFMPAAFKALGFHEPSALAPQFLLRAVATIGVASVSWYVVERPINGLKRYFEYGKLLPGHAAPDPATMPAPAPAPGAAPALLPHRA